MAPEHDMVGGKKFIEKALVLDSSAKAADDEDAGRAGCTNSALAAARTRMLRGCCADAIAITVVLLEDEKNFWVASMVVAVCEPLLQWHGRQNVELRDVHRTAN